MNKNLPLLLITLLTYGSSFGQLLNWVQTEGRSYSDNTNEIEFNTSGDLLIAGDMMANASALANWEGNNNENDRQAFVAKYSVTGTLQWGRLFGYDCKDMAIDINDNTYITGGFEKTSDFDPGVGEALGQNGGIYINSFDDNGDFRWVKTFGNKQNYDDGLVLEAFSTGGVFAAGIFSQSVTLGEAGNEFNFSTTATYGGSWFTRLDEAGNTIWANYIDGESAVHVSASALDQSDNIYITGTYRGTVDFDPSAAVFELTSTVTPNGLGNLETFVMKLDANGNFLWAKSTSTTGRGHVSSNAIDIDANGNVFIGGKYTGDVNFSPTSNSQTLNNGEEDNSALWNPFIWKISTEGNSVWAKEFIGIGQDHIDDLDVDDNGDFYVTGAAGSPSIDVAPSKQEDFYLVNTASVAFPFLVKLNNNGELLWGRDMKGLNQGVGHAVQEHNGAVAWGGFIFATADFDFTSGVHNASSNANSDMFVALASSTMGIRPFSCSWVIISLS